MGQREGREDPRPERVAGTGPAPADGVREVAFGLEPERGLLGRRGFRPPQGQVCSLPLRGPAVLCSAIGV